MAPEVLNSKGYSFTVDIWSLGIMIFEFMCGYVPFGDEALDPFNIYTEIIAGDLTIPSYIKNL